MPRLQKEPSAAQLAAREAGAARLRAAREAKAEYRGAVAPVRSTRTDLDTTDHKIGQDSPREMSSTGPARIEPTIIEPVDRPVTKEKLELLKFMEEGVTIIVHDSTNPTDEPVPYVLNGGRRQAFVRGQEQVVKRKFVEVLARMKVTTYSQEKFKDSQGIDSIRNIPHTALRYTFNVTHDPNPRGKAWLKAILQEG